MRSSVRWAALGAALLALASGGVLAVGPGPLPLRSPGSWTGTDRLTEAWVVVAELAALSLVVLLITRRHRLTSARLVAEGPDRAAARRELLGLAIYLVLAQVGGVVVGLLVSGEPISYHLSGSIHGTHHPPSPGPTLAWAGYNAIAYAALPLWWFGRRYTRAQLWLRSRRPRADILVVTVVLVLESAAQLTLFGAAFLALTGTQLTIGVGLTLGLSFLGTVLPTLVVVAALVVPRVLVVTGSPAAAVVVGGLTYTCLHLFDGWADYGTPSSAAVSVCLLLLQYFAPGMFKAYLTVRTGNAWVHAWAYHAVAPHVWADTPLIVRIFGVR